MVDRPSLNLTRPEELGVLKPEDKPKDTVSCISWAPAVSTKMFACSDWDSKIRIYETILEGSSEKGIVQKSCFKVQEPCLSVSWADDMTRLFTGCIDNSIQSFDMITGKSETIGKHEGPVKDVYWMEASNTLCSLSYDKTAKFWDLRQKDPTMSFDLGAKVYCSDMVFPLLAIGLSDTTIRLVDLLYMQESFAQEPIISPLGAGSQVSAIAISPDSQTLGTASGDGKANVSTIYRPSTAEANIVSDLNFRCHNHARDRIAYPVHSIGFHPLSKKFIFTVGGDGGIIFWDYFLRQRMTDILLPIPITRAKMNADGSLFAYTLGYDWAKGIEGSGSLETHLFVHLIVDSDLESDE